MSANWSVDGARAWRGIPLDKGVVHLRDVSVVETALELTVGRLRAGEHHYSRGPHIQTVHNAGPLLRARVSESDALALQHFDHGVTVPTGCRMDGELRGLIDHHNVVIYEQNRKLTGELCFLRRQLHCVVD